MLFYLILFLFFISNRGTLAKISNLKLCLDFQVLMNLHFYIGSHDIDNTSVLFD